MAEARPRFRWSAVSAPAFEPLTTAELKAHLRVDLSDEDTLIAALGVAAREYCERQTGHLLSSRGFYLEASGFPTMGGDIVLPLFPITTISQVAWRRTADAVLQVGTANTDYRFASEVGRVRLMPGVSEWPATALGEDAVQITVLAGYTNAQSVPQIAKHAIRLLVGHWYENREAVINGTISTEVKMTVDALLSTLKVREMLL